MEIPTWIVNLPKEAIAWLFTLFGIILTLSIGWVNVRRQNRYDVLKVPADKVISERIRRYPVIYKIISNTIKHIDFPKAFEKTFGIYDLQNFERNFNKWDNENAIFLAKFSGYTASNLRIHVRKLLDCKIADKNYEKLRKLLIEMEIGLRVDLSIYALEAGIIKRAYRGSQHRIRKVMSWVWQSIKSLFRGIVQRV